MPDSGDPYAATALREVPTVERIGPGVPYLDGAESQLLEVMRSAADVSSGSDELNERIVDWPTRYHLSSQRATLFRPLHLAPGTRVLDVGAGTGSLARYLGEQGAEVTALEGNMARAEVAAVRCAELANVRILCGSIDDLDAAEQFDLVTIIGVLEYSVTAIGGAAGPAHLLDAARRRLAPGGAIALAIENQLGLKYLLGGAEDHRGVPWVGIEDYPGSSGARTWSRRELSSMLAASGLSAQRWLYPFPDYKLPAIVLDEAMFSEPDAPELIDLLVTHPVRFWDAPGARLPDASAALRVMVRAGLGPDTSSSFFVLAAPDPAGLSGLAADDVLAWIDGGQRRTRWRRHRRLTSDRRLVTADPSSGSSDGWLRQEVCAERAFLVGATLGQQLAERLHSHDEDGVAAVLRRWWSTLEERASPADPAMAASATHPFLRDDTTRVLPDGYLDLNPSNFVDDDGRCVLIDDEWRVGTPIDLDVAAIRALWVTSQEIVSSGIHHPWGRDATIGEVFAKLCGMVGLNPTAAQMRGFRAAELALQHIVSGAATKEVLEGWLNPDLSGRLVHPDELLAADRDVLRATLETEREQFRQDRERLSAELEERIGQLDHYTGLLAARDAALAHLRTPRGVVGAAVRRLRRLGR